MIEQFVFWEYKLQKRRKRIAFAICFVFITALLVIGSLI